MTQPTPAIVLAAQSKTILAAAHAYHKLGFSLLPLHGKRPAVKEWTQFQLAAAAFVALQYRQPESEGD
jgi:hypothetical protein